MKKVLLVASDAEYNQIKPLTNLEIVKTGIGFCNVIETLSKVDKNIKFINIGYAGSNLIPRGTVVKIKDCYTFHPNCGYDYQEPVYHLNGDTDCYTSGDFVVATTIDRPVVFDMELSAICAFGLNVESYKLVSDCLCMQQYNEANFTDGWKQILKEIEEE